MEFEEEDIGEPTFYQGRKYVPPLGPANPVTYFKIRGRKSSAGDRNLVFMQAAINKAASELQLGQQQRDAAIYLYQKARKQEMLIHDINVAARALLFVAGRNSGLKQSINRFIPKEKTRLFLRYIQEVGYKPVAMNEVAIMAKANEILTKYELTAFNRDQVHKALEKMPGGIKSPEVWVIVHEFAKTNRWKPGQQVVLSQGELASEAGMSLRGIAKMYENVRKPFQERAKEKERERKQAEKYLGVKEKRKQQRLQDELIFKCNWKIKRLEIAHYFHPAQVRDALAHRPPIGASESWLWVIAYYLVTSGAVPKREGNPITDRAAAHLISVPYSTFEKYKKMVLSAR